MQKCSIDIQGNLAKPLVSGSASSNYLIEAAKLILKATPKPAYYTPKNVIDFVNKDCIIINPPYNVEK
jgi:hypothetical protein